MSTNSTSRMLSAYIEQADAPLYFAKRFQSPRENFFNGRTVQFDVQREGRPIAVAISDISTGHRMNKSTLYTNKEFEVPVFNEAFGINALETLNRQPGDSPFDDPNFKLSAQREFGTNIRRLVNKIRRSVELQCSQVLQTGIVTLKDSASNSIYQVDFGMRANHKISVAVAWDNGASTKITDLLTAINRIRVDGKKSGTMRVDMGQSAFQAWITDTNIRAILDNRRFEMGGVNPQAQEIGTFQGYFWIGGSQIEIWTYDGSYDDPATGVDTPYLSPWNVIVSAPGSRWDLVWGGLPRLLPPDPRLDGLSIGSLQSPEGGLALTTNAWTNDEGTAVFGSVGTRVLAIPTAIDTFAVINTKPGA